MHSSGPARSSTDEADLVVIAFPTEARAEELRQKLVVCILCRREYLIHLGDAAAPR